jgi:DNA-binding transcriptional ArsR family regulator
VTEAECTNSVEPDLAEVDVITVLHALADPVRLDIVRQLAGCVVDTGMTCSQVRIPVSKSTGTHHFKTLAKAGIIERAEGTRKYLTLRRIELDQHFPGLIASVLAGKA